MHSRERRSWADLVDIPRQGTRFPLFILHELRPRLDGSTVLLLPFGGLDVVVLLLLLVGSKVGNELGKALIGLEEIGIGALLGDAARIHDDDVVSVRQDSELRRMMSVS